MRSKLCAGHVALLGKHATLKAFVADVELPILGAEPTPPSKQLNAPHPVHPIRRDGTHTSCPMHCDSLQRPIDLLDPQARQGRVLVDVIIEHQPRGACGAAIATALKT